MANNPQQNNAAIAALEEKIKQKEQALSWSQNKDEQDRIKLELASLRAELFRAKISRGI